MKRMILTAMTLSAATAFAVTTIDSYPSNDQCNEDKVGEVYAVVYSEGLQPQYFVCVKSIDNCGATPRYQVTGCSDESACLSIPTIDDKCSSSSTETSASSLESASSTASAECQWYPSNVTCDESTSGSTVQCSGNPGDPLMTFKCNGNSWENITGSVSSSSATEPVSSEAAPVGSSASENPTSSAGAPASSASGAPESSATTAIEDIAISATFQVAVRGADLSISVASGSKVQVQVFDMMGHVVKTDVKSLSAGTHSVSLQSLAQGSYMVRISSGSSTQTVRVNVR